MVHIIWYLGIGISYLTEIWDWLWSLNRVWVPTFRNAILAFAQLLPPCFWFKQNMYASHVKRNSVCHYLRRTKGNSLIKIVWHTVFTQRLWEVKKLRTLNAHRTLFFFCWCCLEVEVWQLSDSFYPAAAAPACQPRSHRIRTISPLFIFVS